MLKILTLNWNGKDKLERLYQSLIGCLGEVDYEWHIKDNGSEDGSYEYIDSLKNKNINVIRYPHNKDNFAQGCNFLFKQCSPKNEDNILLLNNDVVFNDSLSIKLMLSILSDSKVGIVGAKIKFTGSNKIEHGGVVFGHTKNYPYHFRRNEDDDKHSSMDREFQAVTAAVMMIRPGLYENICRTNKSKMHGLDENFVWAFEDVAGCLAVKHDMNKKVVYCGKTNISHDVSHTLNKRGIRNLLLPQNLMYFNKKWSTKYIRDDFAYLKNKKYNLYKP